MTSIRQSAGCRARRLAGSHLERRRHRRRRHKRAETSDGCLELRLVLIERDDPGALCEERFCEGESDPLCGTGDDDALVLEAAHVRLLMNAPIDASPMDSAITVPLL